MTAYSATRALVTGNAVTKVTATASADTVPINSYVLLENTSGTNIHNVTFGTAGNAKFEGLNVPTWVVNLPVSSQAWVHVPGDLGDAFGNVAVAVDGTATDITYYVLGF